MEWGTKLCKTYLRKHSIAKYARYSKNSAQKDYITEKVYTKIEERSQINNLILRSQKKKERKKQQQQTKSNTN